MPSIFLSQAAEFILDPALGFFFSREIADVRIWTAPSDYDDGPAAILDHFGAEFRLLSSAPNMRPDLPVFQPVGQTIKVTTSLKSFAKTELWTAM